MTTTNSPGTLSYVEGVGTVFTPDVTITVTISIGRNIGAKAMSATRWATFRAGIAHSLRSCCATVYVADAKSTGLWDGVAEETRTFVASVDPSEVVDLRADLRYYARKFEQDAIALTTGTTELVAP